MLMTLLNSIHQSQIFKMDELEFKIFMIKLQLNLFIIAMRSYCLLWLVLLFVPGSLLCQLLLSLWAFVFYPKKEKGQFHLYYFSLLFARVVSKWLVVRIDSTNPPVLGSPW